MPDLTFPPTLSSDPSPDATTAAVAASIAAASISATALAATTLTAAAVASALTTSALTATVSASPFPTLRPAPTA